MMKFRILLSLLLLLNVTAVQRTWADTALCTLEPSQGAATEGSYSGVMDVAMSKGKTFKGRAATFVLRKGMLCCDLPKMGKMPGKISIELPVKVDGHGRLTARPEDVAGVMKMPMGFRFKLYLEELKSARIVGNRISFTLKVYGQMMGTKFPTAIDFRGETR